jgi:hypothetical protein
VRAGEAGLVDSGTHATAYLGGDDDLIARPSERFERGAGEPLAFTFGVDVGRVDEIDAGVERGANNRLRLPFILPPLSHC